MKTIRTFNKGWTYLEIVIAMIIGSIVLLGVAPMFTQGLRTIGASGNHTRAAILAQNRMEDLKGQPYSYLVNYYGISTTSGAVEDVEEYDSILEVSSDLRSIFKRVTKFQFVDVNSNGIIETDENEHKIMRITVTVFWAEAKYGKNVSGEYNKLHKTIVKTIKVEA